MVDYILVDETNGVRYNHTWCRVTALVLVYVLTSCLVFLSWNSAYNETVNYPPLLAPVPDWLYRRAHIYANSLHDPAKFSHDFRILQKNNLIKNQTLKSSANTDDKNENNTSVVPKKLVCYYASPDGNEKFNGLQLSDVPANLCTHINVGPAEVYNSSLRLSEDLQAQLKSGVPVLHSNNPQLKLLLWVGAGGMSSGFPTMVRDHGNRKIFIQSLRAVLRQYKLNGVDLDWEFPSAYNKERQHFSQLLYEIHQEYRREKRNYLLSVAAAAPEGIALFAYDVRELNLYVDYVNLMTYDYHFWSRSAPFTGLNAPLYARRSEGSIFGTLNINYSVHWWLANGLERNKLIVGLPTYGHSFKLVNPFNNVIGAPAESIGRCGSKGFTTYSEVCWFESHNMFVSLMYDQQTCSPYIYSGTEWISFENDMSIECKARYARGNDLGGVMMFSLNGDGFGEYCSHKTLGIADKSSTNLTFPLIQTAQRVLFRDCDSW